MVKNELVAVMAEKAGMTKKDTEKVLDVFIETVKETVAKKEKVTLMGFGTWEVRQRAAREARVGINPKTKEKIDIPATVAKVVPVFKAGKGFKESVK